MIEELKPFYEGMLRPLVRVFVWLRITPNQLTVLGVLVSAVAAWLVAIGRWQAGCWTGVVGAFMDGWDGVLARETGQKSSFGAVLDSTADRLAETALVFGILFYLVRQPVLDHWGVFLSYGAITGSLMVSYVKARTEGHGYACRGGILQRPERLIVLLGCLLLGPWSIRYGLGVVTALSYLTVGQRLLAAHRSIRSGTRHVPPPDA